MDKENMACKELENYDGVVEKAFLEHISGINSHCATHDQHRQCDIMNCLYCDNSYFKITLANGDGIISTAEELSKSIKEKVEADDYDYEILFYDSAPTADELYSYLFSDSSSYRFVRVWDNIIIIDHFKKQKQLSKTLETKHQ